MENKIEYELSDELAGKLDLERLFFRKPELCGIRWGWCVFWGICGAILLGYSCLRDPHFGGSSPSDPIFETIGTISGFFIGFGYAWKSQRDRRKEISRDIKKRVIFWQVKRGTHRSLDWNTESFAVKSPASQFEYKWLVVDKIIDGKIGIHFLCGDDVIFSLPKSVLPNGFAKDELIKVWCDLMRKALRT